MKILIHYRHFPVAIGRYFDWAFRDLGHEVFSVGCYNQGKIPWGEQFDFPQYAFPPDLQIEEIEAYPIEAVLNKMPWTPDIIIQASDVTYLTGKVDIPNVVVATDPHCINYLPRLQSASHFACMQKYYMERYPNFKNKFWVPYAYYPDIHKKLRSKKIYDVVLIGLLYDHRKDVLDKLVARGHNVFNELGHLYDEYNEIYNKGKVAFNYSSKLDLPARFWEGLAMGNCVVTNNIPELDYFEFHNGTHYLGYNDSDEAVAVIEKALSSGSWETIADAGHKLLLEGKHTYQDRCNLILDTVL